MQNVTIDIIIKDSYNYTKDEVSAKKEIGVGFIKYTFKQNKGQVTIYKFNDDSLEITNDDKKNRKLEFFLSKTSPSKLKITFQERLMELEVELLKYEKDELVEIEYILVDDPKNIHNIKFQEKR